MKLRHIALALLLAASSALGDGYFSGTNTFYSPGTFTIQSGVPLYGSWVFGSGSTLDVTNATKIGFPTGGGGAVTSVFGRTGTIVATIGDYTASQVGAEPALGNPSASGYVLSSTAAGVRSWIAQPSGGGNVSSFGTPTANQKAVWTDATHIQGIPDNGMQWDGGATGLVAATGRASLGLVIGTNVEAWDADLDAIAALTGTNVIYYRAGPASWLPVTIGVGLSFSSGKLDNTVTAGVASFNSRTGAVLPAANDYSFTQLSGSATAAQMPAYTGDVTSPAGSTVNTIAASAVTYAKIQNVTAGTFLGRGSASSGPPQELNDGGGLYIAGTVVNAKALFNASTATQTSSGSEVYLTGSMLNVAGGDFTVGTTYHAVIQVSKTAAGTNAATYTLRCGTGGGTGDAAVIVGNLGTQTAVADTGIVDLYYTFTSIGASANVIGTGNLLHNISNGLFPTAGGTITVGSVATGTAFASGSATKIGISWNAGLGSTHTLLVLRAELTRP